MADVNVPPIDEQNAEHAAAPKQEAIQLVEANGMDSTAPIFSVLVALSGSM